MANPLKSILFFAVLNLVAQPGFCLPSLGWNEAIFFYREPKSSFSSGQAPLRDLERSIRKSDLDFVFQVQWNNRSFRVNANQVLRDVQTSTWLRTKGSAIIYESPQLESLKILTLKANTSLRVLSVLNHWASVYDGQSVGWIPFHHTTTVREDPGAFVALIDTYIRTRPQQGAPIFSTAAKGSRWIPQQIMEDWLEIQWEGQHAYLDLAHLAHRVDFSNWAYHQSRGWIRVKERFGGVLTSTSNEKFPLKEFHAFETDPKKALITESISEGPQLRSRVLLENISASRWIMSYLDGHGEVWWKRELFKDPTRNQNKDFLDFEKIIKKDLFSLSFGGGGSQNHSVSGLASSHGVYRTHDGQSWEKLKEFGEENLPVCIHPDGIWFVGSSRSFDQGQSFEPFLRWDLVAEIIQSELRRPPLFLKLSRISALKGSQLEITIETGYRQIRLRGHTLGQFWNIVR